jgi:hypothetical protein
MKAVIQIILFVVVIYLGYSVYESIMEPVRLNKEMKKREKVVIKRMKDLRKAELIHKQLHGVYLKDWDSLVQFIDTAEIPVVKILPDPEDTTYTKTIKDTVGYVRVYDTIFHNQKVDLSKFMLIPFSNGDTISLNAGKIEKGGVTVQVFEAKAPYKSYLKGMPEQFIINQIASKKDVDLYPGIKVGNMNEPSTSGNWE